MGLAQDVGEPLTLQGVGGPQPLARPGRRRAGRRRQWEWKLPSGAVHSIIPSMRGK